MEFTLCSSSSEVFGSETYKSNSKIYSAIDGNSNTPVKPITAYKEHIDLPKDLFETNKLLDKIDELISPSCVENRKQDEDSEEIFSDDANKKILIDLNRKSIIDKIFDQYDDLYAKLVSKTPEAPAISNSPSPSLLTSPTTPSSKPWKYVTMEKREARRRAAIEGQKNVCRALKKKGIQPEEYFSSVFSSPKKYGDSKEFGFECSTPKENMLSAIVSKPLNSSNLNTPISGVKKLPNFPEEINSTPFQFSVNGTPHYSDISLNETLSPVHDLTPEMKSNLLSGIVCHVDVRSDNRDVSKSIETQVRTLGARIEKNFTKKVTHVIFKEGKVSTYLKAKKEGIPLVSVLWIEACKRVRGIADPAEHRPAKMGKYDNILPFQTIKKRRMKFYNPNSKIRKNILEHFYDPSFIPTLSGKKLESKKAGTMCKDKAKVIGSVENEEHKGIKKYCTKKLTFDKEEEHLKKNENLVLCERNTPQKEITGQESLLPLNDSSFDSMPDIKNKVLRRESAPARKILKNTKKIFKASVKNVSKVTISDETISTSAEKYNGSSTVEETKEANKRDTKEQQGKVEIDEVKTCDLRAKKKRKLFDPKDVHVSLNEGEVCRLQVPAKRPQTRATAGRQLVKVAVARK